MRRLLRCIPSVACLLGGAAAGMQAQAPEPDVYDVDGTRVVHLRLPDREVLAAQLYILGGARQLTEATAGIEGLILEASERGTAGFPGDSLRRAQARTGSRYFVRTTPDWSVIGFTGLAEEFGPSWTILADRVARPSLDSAAVEVVRNQALTFLRASSEDPDEMASRLAERLAFEGHPYAVDVNGTEASLTTLDLDDLRTYHEQQFVRSRMLLAVVGPIDRSTIETTLRSTLGNLPPGSYAWTPPPRWAKPEARVAVEERMLPTNYIVGYFAGPETVADDYPSFQVAVNVLSGYVSSLIRDRGLSYAAGAYVIDRAAAGGAVTVSTVRPTESLEIINRAIEIFRENAIDRSVLRNYAEDSALEYYLSNQTSSQQAEFLATSLLLRGRPQSVVGWVADLRAVAGNQVRGIFRNYIGKIQYGYLGRAGAVPRDLMLRW